MGDWSQKKNKKLILKNPPESSEKKLSSSKSSNQCISKFTTPTIPNSVILQFGSFGKYKMRGHHCLCDMDHALLTAIDVFFKKAQQTMCDVDSFLNN
jgi:hypothetical protein